MTLPDHDPAIFPLHDLFGRAGAGRPDQALTVLLNEVMKIERIRTLREAKLWKCRLTRVPPRGCFVVRYQARIVRPIYRKSV